MLQVLGTKEKMEYFNEMERLFASARPINDNENLPSAFSLNMSSPYNQSVLGNRSSSSADSTSPESYMDLATPRRDGFQSRLMTDSPMPGYERPITPFTGRRQRPIMGRKIFASDSLPINHERPLVPIRSSKMDVDPHQPSHEPFFMQGTPPNMMLENSNYSQNVFYELFPSENKGYEFQTPVKQSQNMMASSDVSPSFSVSPCQSNMSFTTSPNKFVNSPAQNQIVPSPVYVKNYRHGRTFGSRSPSFDQAMCQYPDGHKLCTFCRKNGETPLVYMTHCVKERVGNRQVVTCPILRSHVCHTCGASGDNAHTITYCPVLRSSNNGKPIPSTTITLKNTRVKSNGRRRF